MLIINPKSKCTKQEPFHCLFPRVNVLENIIHTMVSYSSECLNIVLFKNDP